MAGLTKVPYNMGIPDWSVAAVTIAVSTGATTGSSLICFFFIAKISRAHS